MRSGAEPGPSMEQQEGSQESVPPGLSKAWSHLRIAVNFKQQLLQSRRRSFATHGGFEASPAASSVPPHCASAPGLTLPPSAAALSASSQLKLDTPPQSNPMQAFRRNPSLFLAVPGSFGSSQVGEWTTQGVWEATPVAVEEAVLPENLQRIEPEDVIKVKELGRGQFGSVWLGRWLGIQVAMKELHSSDGRSRQDLMGEAEMLASLRHPCVVAFYGVVAAEPLLPPLTVTEFMCDGSLRGALIRLRQDKHFMGPRSDQRNTLARIALPVARGMEYLHRQNIVHFDLKAENLLCDLRNLDSPVVKIGDMGLSRVKMDSDTYVSGSMRGTIPWMAPELFFVNQTGTLADGQTEGLVTEKVDVFSFGVVLWEIWMLGETPYQNLGSMGEIFHGVMEGKLRPQIPEEGCDAAWQQLMVECWANNAADRPSFANVAERLEEIMHLGVVVNPLFV